MKYVERIYRITPSSSDFGQLCADVFTVFLPKCETCGATHCGAKFPKQFSNLRIEGQYVGGADIIKSEFGFAVGENLLSEFSRLSGFGTGEELNFSRNGGGTDICGRLFRMSVVELELIRTPTIFEAVPQIEGCINGCAYNIVYPRVGRYPEIRFSFENGVTSSYVAKLGATRRFDYGVFLFHHKLKGLEIFTLDGENILIVERCARDLLYKGFKNLAFEEWGTVLEYEESDVGIYTRKKASSLNLCFTPDRGLFP